MLNSSNNMTICIARERDTHTHTVTARVKMKLYSIKNLNCLYLDPFFHSTIYIHFMVDMASEYNLGDGSFNANSDHVDDGTTIVGGNRSFFFQSIGILC